MVGMRSIVIIGLISVFLLGCISAQTNLRSSNQSVASNCDNIVKSNTAVVADALKKISDKPTWCNNLVNPYYTPTKEEALWNCYSLFDSEFFTENWTVYQLLSSPHWGQSAGENINYYYVDVELVKETKLLIPKATYLSVIPHT